eukprot:CAMPEP_0117028328 /NCGR_PEP_ID=MMETSP0472-20121206/20607_1 /TAXON_ID=693140 ORGANISM="Tiarina fusus, Strain LIS" /NCGR_SAMPLE_ID=MMETSP0472 /ASSEMBLY_ACC=CAM_ASM_000603 /LENGTH=552 /DNA_ID=CAMNT_0004735785 /DNA_START=112 /DNA_END=1771 /DNA_ORIENTATION=+
MNFQNQLITLFLTGVFLDRVHGFLPAAVQLQRSWGGMPVVEQTHLGVAASTPTINSAVDSEDYELSVEDLEDVSFEELEEKKAQWMADLRLCARTSARDPDAVARAQSIFDEMFEAYVTSEETSMWPEVDVYNLLIETHAYSKAEDGGEEAERLLSRMEDESVDFIARPNLSTYMGVIDAWAMRKSPERAQGVVDRLRTRYEETGDESIQPTADASGDESIQPTADVMNKLIKAHGMAGDAEKAESIFRDLLEEEGELKANYKSWIQTMKAYASSPEGTEKVSDLFQEMVKAERMGEEEYKPRTAAYNAKIKALSMTSDGAAEAEAMLFDMISKFREGDECLRPDAETFRNVMTAHRRLKSPSGAKIEHLLQIQDGLYGTYGMEDLKLDERQYHVAMGIIARSREHNKATIVRRLVEKLKNSNDPNIPVSERAYYTLLSACAYTNGTPEQNFAAFQIAVDTLKELREFLGHEPDSACFGMFLRACANLMPESPKRDGVVRSVFKKCCAEGHVNDFVLLEFERASSEALELELLGGFLADDVRIPKDWRRNIK